MVRGTEIRAVAPIDCQHAVELKYEERFQRRRVMTTLSGDEFLLDLPKAQELPNGGAIRLESGEHVQIFAAEEPVMIANPKQAKDLARIAWHIGNRHMNCEVHSDHLVLLQNHVIAEMLTALGCEIQHDEAPFQPEGGAYGIGRTHSHEH